MTLLKKVCEVLQTVRTPGGLSAILHSRPRSLTSFRITQNVAADGVNFRTIIDGGANVGQFARAASQTFPAAKIYSFEPLPDVVETLQRNLSDLPSHQVFRSALGNTDGEIEFRRNSYNQSSSILPVGEHRLPAMKGISEKEKLRVPIGRLDTLLANSQLTSPILLKLDLQGYELEALKGAEQLLDKCHSVLLEAAFEEMYEGEPLFDEVLGYLRRYGFRFIRPVHMADDAQGKILQIDALFRR